MVAELERMWTEFVVAYFGGYPGFCLERLRKITNTFNPNNVGSQYLLFLKLCSWPLTI